VRLKASSMLTDCLYRCWWKHIVLWVFSFFFSSLLPFALVLTISLSFPPSFLLCHLAAVFKVQCGGKQVFDMKPVCVCLKFLLSEMWSRIASFPAFICFFHDTDWMLFYGTFGYSYELQFTPTLRVPPCFCS